MEFLELVAVYSIENGIDEIYAELENGGMIHVRDYDYRDNEYELLTDLQGTLVGIYSRHGVSIEIRDGKLFELVIDHNGCGTENEVMLSMLLANNKLNDRTEYRFFPQNSKPSTAYGIVITNGGLVFDVKYDINNGLNVVDSLLNGRDFGGPAVVSEKVMKLMNSNDLIVTADGYFYNIEDYYNGGKPLKNVFK